MSQNHSPFKFLDAYEKKDIKVFFGREKETQALYDALSGVKHLLIYGPSGSGKSSLVECGLRNQFSDADWFALTIRKSHDINASVFMTINDALTEKIELDPKTHLPVDESIGFTEAIEELFEERYQPIYLLFDQFEELLISGTHDEKVAFFSNLNKLIRNRIPSRILLIMREEFIGHFSEFEHLCPSIFQHRFRVEKMGRSQVQEVVQAMLEAPTYREHFDVTDSAVLAEKIMTKLPDQRKEIELSHVQVFLGELWDRANENFQGQGLPVFSADLIRKRDNLESVLESFLKKQMTELEKDYGKMIPLEVLATMISEKFTKLQLSEKVIKAKLKANDIKSKKPIQQLLTEFQGRRILRVLKVGDESQFEISHDTLALVVGQNLTEEMKIREKANEVYNIYSEREGLFAQEDIDYLRPFEQYAPFPSDLNERIKKSIENIKAAENEKLATQKKRLARTRMFAAIISVVGVGAIIASIFAYLGTQRAKLEARKAQSMTLSTLPVEYFEKDPTLAIGLLQLARENYQDSTFGLKFLNKTLKTGFNKYFVKDGNLLYKDLGLKVGARGKFSEDGKTVVSIRTRDSIIEIRDVSTGEIKSELETKWDGKSISFTFSKDGTLLATYDNSPVIEIWKSNSGDKISEITLEGRPYSVEISNNNQELLTASNENKVKLWHTQSGEFKHLLLDQNSLKLTARYSSDGDLIAVDTGFNALSFYEAGTFDLIKQVEYQNGVSLNFDLSYDNSKFLIVGQKWATIYDQETGNKIRELSIPEDMILDKGSFSPNGKYVLIVDRNNIQWLFDIQTGLPVFKLMRTTSLLEDSHISKNNSLIYSAFSDGKIKVFDLNLGNELDDLANHLSELEGAKRMYYSEGKKYLFIVADSGTEKIFQLEKPYKIIDLQTDLNAVDNILFADIPEVMLRVADRKATTWNLKTGEKIADLNSNRRLRDSRSFEISSDGRYAIVGYDDSLELFDARSGSLIETLEGNDRQTDHCFSKNGEQCATSFADGSIKIWETQSGDLIKTIEAHKTPITSISYSIDTKSLVSTADDKTLAFWDVDNDFKQLATENIVDQQIKELLVSPNGKHILTINSSTGGPNTIIDTKSGKTLYELVDSEYFYNHPTISSDGKSILNYKNDMVVVWNAYTGEKNFEITNLKGKPYMSFFTADGHSIITFSITPNSDIVEVHHTLNGISNWLEENSSNYSSISRQDLLDLGFSDGFIDNLIFEGEDKE